MASARSIRRPSSRCRQSLLSLDSWPARCRRCVRRAWIRWSRCARNRSWLSYLIHSIVSQFEAFVFPAFDTADHFFYGAIELRQADGRAIGTVAVRAIAVYDEQGLRPVRGKGSLGDQAMRQADGAWHVSACEMLGATHVENDEPRVRLLQRRVHVPAIGFER